MKLIQSLDQELTIEFFLEELSLLRNVLGVPVHAFAVDNFSERVGADISYIDKFTEKFDELVQSEPEFLKLRQSSYYGSDIKSYIKMFKININDFLILKNALEVAIQVTGESEMHCLTGYDWKEALELQEGFRMIAKNIAK